MNWVPSFPHDEVGPAHRGMVGGGQLDDLASGRKRRLAGGAVPGGRGHPVDEKVASVVANAISLGGFWEAEACGGDRLVAGRDVVGREEDVVDACERAGVDDESEETIEAASVDVTTMDLAVEAERLDGGKAFATKKNEECATEGAEGHRHLSCDFWVAIGG